MEKLSSVSDVSKRIQDSSTDLQQKKLLIERVINYALNEGSKNDLSFKEQNDLYQNSCNIYRNEKPDAPFVVPLKMEQKYADEKTTPLNLVVIFHAHSKYRLELRDIEPQKVAEKIKATITKKGSFFVPAEELKKYNVPGSKTETDRDLQHGLHKHLNEKYPDKIKKMHYALTNGKNNDPKVAEHEITTEGIKLVFRLLPQNHKEVISLAKEKCGVEKFVGNNTVFAIVTTAYPISKEPIKGIERAKEMLQEVIELIDQIEL